MAAIKPNNPDMNEPTGSLEDLFRQHLAEAEVPVRPMLWEQIDNSLLIEQNALYRRRLTITRWVAAASLALASLAGGGWWAAQQATNNTVGVAATRTVSTNSQDDAGHRGSTATATSVAANADASAALQATEVQGGVISHPTVRMPSTLVSKRAEANAHNQVATRQGRTYATPRAIASNNPTGTRWRRGASTSTTAVKAALSAATAGPSATVSGLAGRQSANAAWADNGSHLLNNSTNQRFGNLASGNLAAGNEAGNYPADAAFTSLNSRLTFLQLAAIKALPSDLTTLPVTPAALPLPLPKWQFGASYAVSAFNPNINFSREGSTDYIYNLSAALGDNSSALSEAAAAEYRQHLQAGTGQRLALHATRRLGKGRWNLTTGVEVAQADARSATSVSYVGEQLYDLGQTTGNSKLRDTQFRYRTAGVPVELTYSNPIKRGWSTYGRVGAAVSALFNVRAEVAGVPEASRTYSLQSAGGTYRKVLVNVRGAAGIQFRPTTGSYTLSLGPVAEAGLLSLNAHPAEDFLHQNRAYSLGIEAGVAFGK